MRPKKLAKLEVCHSNGACQSNGSLQNENGENIPTTSEAQTASSSKGRGKYTMKDIKFVQNLIERCLCYDMTEEEVVNTLAKRVDIEPCVTTLVWQNLREENPEFFSNYDVRLSWKEQINWYHQLIKHQIYLVKEYLQYDCDPLPVNSSIRDAAEQFLLHFGDAAHIDSSLYESPYPMVDGVPAARDSYPIQQNGVASSDYQEMATEPNAKLSFEPDEMSSLVSAQELQPAMYVGSRNAFENMCSHTNLTTSLTNAKDPPALESYQSCPFPYPGTVGTVAHNFAEYNIEGNFIKEVQDLYDEAKFLTGAR